MIIVLTRNIIIQSIKYSNSCVKKYHSKPALQDFKAVLRSFPQNARRPDLPDDALVIFSDLDEVPSSTAIQMLRVCKTIGAVKAWQGLESAGASKDGPWIQAHYPMPYNLRVGCKPKGRSQ